MTRHIIAILRGIQQEEAVEIARCIIEAGISDLEVPLNSPSPFESISRILQTFGGQARVGAGTVLKESEVEQLAKLGAHFVVSPNCDSAVIRKTKQCGMLSYPGVFTPSECLAAIDAGADGLKLFPASMMGPEGVKALKDVLPVTTPLYAVGGVSPDNFADWKAAGATGFGIGGALYKAGMSLATIAQKAKNIVAAYDRLQER